MRHNTWKLVVASVVPPEHQTGNIADNQWKNANTRV
jgi:hypothetical protein